MLESEMMVCLVAKGSKFIPLRVRKSSLVLKRLSKADPYIYTVIILPQAISHVPPTSSKRSRQTCTAHRLATSSAGFVESFRICLKMLPALQFLNTNFSPSVRSSHRRVEMCYFDAVSALLFCKYLLSTLCCISAEPILTLKPHMAQT